MTTPAAARGGKSVDALRGVLLCGSLVCLASGAFLIVVPDTFATLFGLATSAELAWALRVLGASLVGMAGLLWQVRHAPGTPVRRASLAMAAGGGLMTVFALVAPGTWTVMRWSYLGVGAMFVVLCLLFVALGRARAVDVVPDRRSDARDEAPTVPFGATPDDEPPTSSEQSGT